MVEAKPIAIRRGSCEHRFRARFAGRDATGAPLVEGSRCLQRRGVAALVVGSEQGLLRSAAIGVRQGFDAGGPALRERTA
jgi:hypothetical protein